MIDESLETPEKVRELQINLYRKAKSEPNYRFYLLHDKVYRKDVLLRAWMLAKANHEAPGVDGKSFEDIESEGSMEWLEGLDKDLREKTYEPQPIRSAFPDLAGVGVHIAVFEACSSFTPPARQLSNPTINYSSGFFPTGNQPLGGTRKTAGATRRDSALQDEA